MSESRIIKKYPNRRLYDTEVSKYITLDAVKELVVKGVDFKVVDAKTDKDITRSTLMQIITEQEEKGEPILTQELLRNLIRFYDNALGSVIGRYLEQSLSFFIEQQKNLKGRVSKVISSKPISLVTDITERNLKLWKTVHGKLYDATLGNHSRRTDIGKDSPEAQADEQDSPSSTKD